MDGTILPTSIAMITDDFIPAKTGVGVHVQKIAMEYSGGILRDRPNLIGVFHKLSRTFESSRCFHKNSIKYV